MRLKKNERWLARDKGSWAEFYVLAGTKLGFPMRKSGDISWHDVNSEFKLFCAKEIERHLAPDARLQPGEGPIKVEISIKKVGGYI